MQAFPFYFFFFTIFFIRCSPSPNNVYQLLLFKLQLVLMVLLFLTHLQSLEFALYLETPTTTLLMDGHLTFREHVSTFWQKTAPPLPRPSRCWWKTMLVGPDLFLGQNLWTLCWAEIQSASSNTLLWSGMGPGYHSLARHHSFRSTWMVICWK